MTQASDDDASGLPGPELERLRNEIIGFLHRMVAHPQLAEDLAQETLARALRAFEGAPPAQTPHYRAWMFRIATYLALDALRKIKRHGEVSMISLRQSAEGTPAFMEKSAQWIGTPETVLVASEHLVACFSCTLRNLPELKAAALLLREVHDFSVNETAGILEISVNQAKNAIQDARQLMKEKYDSTCALIAKQGICYQCSELADFFQAPPVAADLGGDSWHARVEIVKAFAMRRPGVWHQLMLGSFLPGDDD